ncbi:MAG: sodium:solute symporter [Bacteroidales bacterium]
MWNNPYIFLSIIFGYFGVLLLISWGTTYKVQSSSFYLGTRKTPWYIIAFGMLGSSLSGITFISVPGMVADSQFSYLQMVLGFIVGYLVVAQLLLPLYYRMRLTSIYSYLETRFGRCSYKTGASFFLLSRLFGSAIRLLIITIVLQAMVFNSLGIPFWLNAVFTIGLIFVYTYRGGVKTIIWTDTLQTFAILSTLVLCLVGIASKMNLSLSGTFHLIAESEFSRIFFFDDPKDTRYFFKQFIAGVFTTISMTGLDQDLMQKNLSCRNLKEAQRNMHTYGIAFLPVNLLFLSLGVLLYTFVAHNGISLPSKPDELFPLIATSNYLHPVVGLLFVIGIIAASYSSADSALTALTTSFSIDILGLKADDAKLKRKRNIVHFGMSLLFLALILVLKEFYTDSIINIIYRVASYSYGPLLGMYAFGLFTSINVKDRYVPIVAIVSPIASFLLNWASPILFRGYKFGFELLLVNGIFTFIGLLCLQTRKRLHQERAAEQ